MRCICEFTAFRFSLAKDVKKQSVTLSLLECKAWVFVRLRQICVWYGSSGNEGEIGIIANQNNFSGQTK